MLEKKKKEGVWKINSLKSFEYNIEDIKRLDLCRINRFVLYFGTILTFV